MWEALAHFYVTPAHNFVLKALWRKLPVAACMFSFKMIMPLDCQLFRLSEDHPYALKHRPYLYLPFSSIRRLRGWWWCMTLT